MSDPELSGEKNVDENSYLSNLQREASYAEEFQKKGHALLHAHMLLGQWSALETFIEELAAGWLHVHPEALRSLVLQKVRVPLAEMLALSDAERLDRIVSEIARDLKVDLANGVSKFEKILDAIGLGGPLDSDLKRAIFEMHQIRNCIAHRAATADQRLIEACPWLELRPGERINIWLYKFMYYAHATHSYAAVVANRCVSAEGDEPPLLDHCFSSYRGKPDEALEAHKH